METIKIAVKEPNKPWEVRLVSNELKAFQKIVGGYIELFWRDVDGLLYFCNEEGKLMNLTPNFYCHLDLIVGTVFAVRDDDDGNFASIDILDESRLIELGDDVEF